MPWPQVAARYALAVGVVGAAVLLRLTVPPLATAEAPFLLFLAAVTLAAWHGGFGPGAAATAVAVAAGNFFFMRPYFAFDLGDPAHRLGVALFVFEAAVISTLCAQLHASRRRALAHAAEARELERQVVRTSDEERRRVGRDLHDGLGQHLTGTALAARLLNRRLAAHSLPEAEDARRLEQLVNDAVARTRDLAAGLSPLPVGPDGLCSGLRDLASGVEEMAGIRCDLRCESPAPPVPDDAAVHLYRIAQEAVTNAVRHARARNVTISLAARGSDFQLCVEDDGAGFPEGRGGGGDGGRSGMGLRTMNYRARVIGASLTWSERPDGGTAVTCGWPLAAGETPQRAGRLA